MNPIHVSMDVRLNPGYSEYAIDSERDLELTFRADQDADVFIEIHHSGKLNLRTYAARGVHVSYLIYNRCDSLLETEETHEVMGDADVTVAYGEINSAETKRNTYMVLREEGARGLFSSASLVNTKKNYRMQVVNERPHTYGDMKNYAVVLKGGKLLIDAVGKVVKGAHGSESHQTSRSLSFEEGQTAEILPELLIDEYDVQASHAMSIGRVDEEQLYYLMSRGLSLAQCTSLISAGYLMPITETLSNPELQEKLKAEMQERIGEICAR
ncbi:MAG: SufD family Fe-S cluster assembly protein [Solobacterium sp.]|jgi:Fe-S cluster assembly protein SufD|nr:SufD family Fe-S cluster assembly protein [Solobacterium sp.]MCH4048099.1 SufD family Fe-S cluster assembly protein [Solobacterium sp.]MCH4075047.1 SufD family Fe-S cluster assembly protein [Solobacterium sp.]MCI1314335.1 SufD family Fe-S cluster assembly protein [Solobacterium sp.]MCI1346715.1 SufD family Fe-S cluster assembly protein [Solobacterium sp.]